MTGKFVFWMSCDTLLLKVFEQRTIMPQDWHTWNHITFDLLITIMMKQKSGSCRWNIAVISIEFVFTQFSFQQVEQHKTAATSGDVLLSFPPNVKRQLDTYKFVTVQRFSFMTFQCYTVSVQTVCISLGVVTLYHRHSNMYRRDNTLHNLDLTLKSKS